jgi:hypothetical protein
MTALVSDVQELTAYVRTLYRSWPAVSLQGHK